MVDPVPVLGAVLLGGRSRRFGSDKAVADLPVAGGGVMGAVAVRALRDAGVDPVVGVGGTSGARLGLITVPDRRPGEGPLTGLITALGYAGTGLVVVVPCDVPRLTDLDVRRLLDAATPDTAAVGMIDGRLTPTLGCWPAAWARTGQAAFDGGARRLDSALEWGAHVTVDLDVTTAADADTPEALAEMFPAGTVADRPAP